jgi:hypothetical protein
MIEWVESNLAAPAADEGLSQLHFFVYEYDTPYQIILKRRGYEKTTALGYGVVWISGATYHEDRCA